MCSTARFLACALTLLFLVLPGLPAAEVDIRGRLTLFTDDALKFTDYYYLRGELEFELEVLDNLEMVLELEADQLEVEMGELFLEWEPRPSFSLKAGRVENALTLDEVLPRFDRIFARPSWISRYIDNMGYVSKGTGVRFAWDSPREGLPLSGFVHPLFVPAHAEVQLSGGLLYHFAGQDSYLGLLGAYFPFLVHEFILGSSDYLGLHNLLGTAVAADHEPPWIFGLELTLGSNLIDPVGLIHYTELEDSGSVFFGTDLYLGHWVRLKKAQWLPALRGSLLLPNLRVPERFHVELLAGNLFELHKRVKLHLDVGLRLYSREIAEQLYSRLEPIWALSFLAET
jgi:hypothetical protein